MPAVARIGDSGSHGGEIITGRPSSEADGRLVACVGDLYACALHGPNPIVTGSSVGSVEGKALARIGDFTSCGAIITTGSPTQFDEG